jgi:hypothetical protein
VGIKGAIPGAIDPVNLIDARVALCVLAARESGDHLYIWGGESSDEGGFDCSGFVCDLLMRANHLWPGIYTSGRTTAHSLYEYYSRKSVYDITDVDNLVPGSIVFYRRSLESRIFHVALHVFNLDEFILSNGRTVPIGPMAIESGGAGSYSKTPRDALRASAGVRMTASDYHGEHVKWVAKDPFTLLSFEGRDHAEDE